MAVSIRQRSLDDVKAAEKAQVTAAANRRLESIDGARDRAVLKLAKGQAVPPAIVSKLEKNAAIEYVRDAAISAIDAATTKADARNVFLSVTWP